MFKKLLSLIILAVLMSFLATPQNVILAHGDHEASLDDVVRDLARKQGVSNPEDLNCDSLSDEDLEKLGEAVMSYMHPNPQVHEEMDSMMGGEGSESLRQAHITMAKSYLGCEGNRWPAGMGMMRGLDSPYNSKNTTQEKASRNSSSVSNYGFPMMPFSFMGAGFLFMFLYLITWVAFVALLVTGIIYLLKKIKNGK